MFWREVGAVDGVPDPLGLGDRLVLGERGVPGEVRRRVAERGLAQPQEPLDVPVADVAGAGVDVDAEVEEVAQRQAGAAVLADPRRLEDVEALDDDDVGALDDDLLVGHHVVDEVGVDRRLDLVLAGLDVDDEPQQRAAVVGLREALALQDARGARARRWGRGSRRWSPARRWGARASGPASAGARGRSSTCRRRPSRRGRSRTACAAGCGRCRNSSCSRCSRPAASTYRLSRRESGR